MRGRNGAENEVPRAAQPEDRLLRIPTRKLKSFLIPTSPVLGFAPIVNHFAEVAMRVIRSGVLLCLLSLFLTTLLNAQNAPTSANQALIALQNALTALAHGSTVNDVTLTGTAERIAGSDNESGTVTYKALPTANRLDLALSGGTRSEIRAVGSTEPTGTWIGPDGVSHDMALHNLMTDPGWFPLFALSNINSSANSLITYIGPETRDNVPVIHLTASQQFPGSTADVGALLQHLTQVDIYLDPATYLPVAYVFAMHPDNDAGRDIPAEIRYASDYRVPSTYALFIADMPGARVPTPSEQPGPFSPRGKSGKAVRSLGPSIGRRLLLRILCFNTSNERQLCV